MRDRNLFGARRGLVRMSWSPENLYNLFRRSMTAMKEETTFTQSRNTLFQQRWVSKRLTRAYHGDHINEKIFKRWYLPTTLPDVRPRKRVLGLGDDTEALSKFSGRDKAADAEKKAREEEDKLAQAPVASLMFEEVERRIDVFIFRCCFAHSVYEARRLVIHGRVKLNGKIHQNANTRLAPGDMVSVDPEAIRFLKPKEGTPKSSEVIGSTEEEHIRAYSEPSAETPAEPSKSSSESSPKPPKRKKPLREPLMLTTPFNLPDFAAPFIFIPPYIEVSFQTCSAIYVRRPTARFNYSEIPTPYDADGEIMRFTWEWYSRVRPRMRSKSQLARMPDNRKETRVIPGIGRARSKPPVIKGTSLRAQVMKNSIS